MIQKIIALLEGRLDLSRISDAELKRLVRDIQLKGTDDGFDGVVREYDRRRKPPTPSRLKYFQNAPSSTT